MNPFALSIGRRLINAALFAGLLLPLVAGAESSPADLVRPQIDTHKSRWFFFSSACRPFGMVNLSPDTRVGGDWMSGYNGDEDQGQMGELSVLMAMGLFDVQGGAAVNPTYQITPPLFDRVTIRLNDRYFPGGEFVITTRGNSPGNVYIQSAKLNGQPLNRYWFSHADLVRGGSLAVELGLQPSRWAAETMPAN